MTHEQMARVIRHEEQQRLIGMIEWFSTQTENKEVKAILKILIKTIEYNHVN